MLRFAPLLLLVLAACSYADLDSEEGLSSATGGTVLNETSAPVFWFALGAEAATLVDPSPEVLITDANRDDVLAPGASADLVVEEYREGEDFVLFLYRVEKGGDLATFAQVQRVDAAEYERTRVVTIEDF